MLSSLNASAHKTIIHNISKKVFFIFWAFIVFRIGSYIPIPFVDSDALSLFMKQNANGLLGVLNTFAGGSVSRMSLFALSIMPYITASIIIQLLTVVHKPLGELRKEGEQGRQKIQNYTRFLAIFLCIFQSYGVSAGLENLRIGDMNVVIMPGLVFRLCAVVTLTGGTVFLIWLGDRITSKGIGNGISLIIFAGIVAEFPKFSGRLLDMASSGAISGWFIAIFFAALLGLVFFVTFMEKAYRKIPIHYAKRAAGPQSSQNTSYIPLKINTAGVIPPIFASSFLLFPATISGFLGSDKETASSSLLHAIVRYLSHGQPLYIIFYASIIVFFSYFYTSIIFNSQETAENLRKNSGYVTGFRPGKSTAEYFDYVLTRMTTIGAFYLCAICLLPEILTTRNSIPFYLGGTSILIIVNVTIDTLSQINMQFYSYKYKSILRKAEKRKKR
ncbi:MAG: preprotein translocase subunit SecY [Rickettsiales bacterium]